MELASISHKSVCPDAYALDDSRILINLKTGKDITSVSLIHDDPFAGGATGFAAWDGKAQPMAISRELKYHYIWSITLSPKFKREQYYFSISDGSESLLMFEDGFYTPEQANKPGRLKQYFKFPWLNASDVFSPPAWVNDTIWYQIMPDRFRRGDPAPKRFPLRDWNDSSNLTFRDFYGGDLKGITEKLPYLHKLGITGIYMTPIFLSHSNHKYNTFSYDEIDPDFGTEEDLIRLVDTAHSLGIRVMLDAVFNHSGTEFAPWKDVMKKGPDSPYWDWFYVNQWPQPKLPGKTDDGRFYSFAFTGMMPKLNTNNPEVADYFLARCRKWVEKWNIDGIRFDVGNEVSHSFLKKLYAGLKAVNPDIFLLGEIWHDASQWLQGGEYDSTMNYPFLESLHNFWLDNQDSKELMYALNRCYSMYPEQVNPVLFNFLDTHDTMRVLTRCGSKDIFYQQLTLLMTMPGSACIYYGTEIAMDGGDDPDCRRPMPWNAVEAGKCSDDLRETAALIALRKAFPQLRRGKLLWKHSDTHPRLLHYGRYLDGDHVIAVYINANEEAVKIPDSNILYSRHLRNGELLPGGIAVTRQEVWQWKECL